MPSLRAIRASVLLFLVACTGDDAVPTSTTNASPLLAVVVPPRALLNENVSYDFSDTRDPDGRITNYFILVADGTPQSDSSKTVSTHLFLATGTFDVTVGATDDRGATTSTLIPIEIRNDPDATCDASATCSGGDVCAGGLCLPARCSADDICNAGFQCAFGYCRLPEACPTDGGTCPGSARRCVANRCLPATCRGADDCEFGETCFDGGCSATN
jgi:hypothetical protein